MNFFEGYELRTNRTRGTPSIISRANWAEVSLPKSAVQLNRSFYPLPDTMLPLDAITIFNYFGAGFALALGVGQLVRPWSVRHLILGLFFVSLAVTNFHFTLIYSHAIFEAPHFLFTNIPLLYLLGPLSYLYVTMATTENFQWKKKQLLHFFPAVVSIGVLFPFYALDVAQKIEILESVIFYNDMSMVRGHVGAPMLVLIFYFGYLGYENNPFLNYRDKKSYVVSGLLLCWLAAIGAGGAVLFRGDVSYLLYSIFFINISIFYIFFLGQRDPRFLNVITSEIKRKKYEKSLLENIDLDRLESHIEELLDMGIYRDDSINLKKMAEMLEVSSHQLSQFLNERQEMNFNSFINRRRIEEAKKILLERPGMAVVGVAYEVGFKSLSSFHEAFRRFYGASPSEYRKERLSKE